MMPNEFDFIFYRGKSFVSKVIELLTKSPYSHVAMCWDSIHVVQLDWRTPISIKHLNYERNSYDIYKLNIQLTDEQKDTIRQFIIDKISKKYDWYYIITRGVNLLFRIKLLNSKDRYDCDELLVEAFKQIGIELLDSSTPLSPFTLSKSKYLYKIT